MLEVASSRELARDALRVLGIERLVVSIHDASFPSRGDEDTGRGSPYSRGARDFVAFVRDLGFDGVQIGPQGETSLGNPSPYDGSVFSKSVLSLPLDLLASEAYARLLDEAALDEARRDLPAGDRRAHHEHAWVVHHRALALASRTLRERLEAGDRQAVGLADRVTRFSATAPWLAHDARFEAFAAEHGTDDFRTWPERDREPTEERLAEIETRRADVSLAWALGQLVLHEQHAALRAHLAGLGMSLFGDVQVGLSLRDVWMRGHLFLPGWLLGAPPSRTNPGGQPWGYRVLDPRGWQRRFVGEGAEARAHAGYAFAAARFAKSWSELDGLRIDHPHGLVCPWVYDAAATDPAAAVARGARLFETPASPIHPGLDAFALVRPDQIDEGVAPYDDHRVRDLDDAQLREYATLFDLLVETAREHGRGPQDLLCEVLSTCPLPLRRVMKRHRLGRFRVTQKANVEDPKDGYRSENAEPGDWIMIGTHDTAPLMQVVDRWCASPATLEARAAYLADVLAHDPRERAAMAASIRGDRARLVLAMAAQLFSSPAKNVLVFFADLLGERDVYNTPGVISPDNWRLRAPRAFSEVYAERRARGEAIDLLGALAAAIRARGFASSHAGLVAALEARAAFTLR
jgi:4-alpha-glucanotransferase